MGNTNKTLQNKLQLVAQSLFIFTPIFLIASILTLTFVKIQGDSNKRTLLEEERLHIKLQKLNIDADITQIISDLTIISDDNDLKTMWDINGIINPKYLIINKRLFLNFAIHRGLYDQIRLLDCKGMELIRINYNNGSPEVVKKENLQNKKGRYYFKESIILNKGELYVSPLDLNIEHGEIEKPLKPMMRFATPLYDIYGKKRGVIILNYFGSKILNNYTSFDHKESNGKSMLLNNEGYWLSSTNKTEEWGFMFPDKKNVKFPLKYPNAWKLINKNEHGQFENDKGVFTFDTVYPLKHKLEPQDHDNIKDKKYHWKVVSFIQREDLNAITNHRNFPITQLILFGILLEFIVLKLVSASNQKKQYQKQLLKSYNEIRTEVQERVASEEKLKLFQLYLSDIIDSMPIILVGVDSNLIVTQWNKKAQEYTSMSNKDVIGVHINETVLSSHISIDMLEECINSGKTINIHEQENNINGTIVYENITYYPLKSNMGDGAVVLIDDITLQVKHDQEKRMLILEKDKAEAANEMKDEFLANISHELRTPLNGILGYAQVLLRHINDKHKIEKGIKVILDSGNHLIEIINDILDLSKIKANKMKLNCSEFDLKQALDSCIDIASADNPQNRSLLKREFCIPEHTIVIGDEVRLKQIILNLLSNALKFTNEGEVNLKVLHIVDNRFSFSVKDTGGGIPNEKIDTIFNPFIQVEHHLNHKEGTGLGLAICSKLVKMMGGKLKVESTEGIGSTFSFEIELTLIPPNNVIDVTDYSRRSQSHCGKTILIVDDLADNREVLSEFLIDEDFDVLLASSGEEAIEMVKKHKPDIVFMDIMMPGIDGHEATKAIRKWEESTAIRYKTKIIALSASVSSIDVKKAIDAGCDCFINKPYKEELILSKIYELLSITKKQQEDITNNTSDLDNVSISHDLYKQLKCAAKSGNLDLIESTIDNIEKENIEQNLEFCMMLRNCAELFQFNKVLELLKEVKGE